MSNNVVVLGATGTVGAYTAVHLKGQGYDVTAAGRRPSDGGFFADYAIPYVSLNIERPSDFEKLPTQPGQHVLHFAGAMPARMMGYDPQQYVASIVAGTLNVLLYAKESNADRIVFTATRADTVHLMGQTAPIPADVARSFPRMGDHSVYAICKNTAVDLIEHFHYEYGLKRFILRLPTIYAYTPDPFFYVGGVRRIKAYRYLIERARRGEPIEIWGDPTREKEIVYVKDFTQIVEKSVEANVAGGIYNVGRGAGVSLDDQIRGIVEVFSPPARRSDVVYRPDKPNAPQFIHDISKTMDELGYLPAYDYRAGLVDFKAEMERNRFRKLWGEPVVDIQFS